MFYIHIWSCLFQDQGFENCLCWSLVLIISSLEFPSFVDPQVCRLAPMPGSAIGSCRRWRSPGAKRWAGIVWTGFCGLFSHGRARMNLWWLTFDSWRYHCSEAQNYRHSNGRRWRQINSPHQLDAAADAVSCSLTNPGSKSSFSSHPSRVYVSPPWRRSTTVGGLLSLPHCLAALWRRWWSDRANFSQTGNCPGCRFSFPSMSWAWVGLRRRASSGKTTPKLAVGEGKLRYYEGTVLCACLCIADSGRWMCVGFLIPIFHSKTLALSLCYTYSRQMSKHSTA